MIHHKGVSEGSMLQLNTLAILHIDKLGGYPLEDKTGGFLLIDNIGRKAGIYKSIFFTVKIISEFYKKSDPKKFQFQL
jgi:hypothetical protein